MTLQYQLLKYLLDGHFHSGEDLAHSLKVTRAAIWKNIQSLQAEFDLDIHAVPGKGYQLAASIELLDKNKIQNSLAEQHAHTEVETFIKIDSTNQYLMQKAVMEKSKNCAVFAETQTAGRGRHGRVWVSPFGGSLYFSVLYQFERGARDIMGLSLAIGVVIAEYLESIGVAQVELKWPNDILVRGSKLCGILMELQGEIQGPYAIVVGVGFNISVPHTAAQKIDQPWTAYHALVQQPIPRNQLAAGLLMAVLDAIEEFKQFGLAGFQPRWQQRDCFFNHPVTIQLGDRQINGISRGIDQHGAVLIEQEGTIEKYYSGEIRLRRSI